MRQFNDYSGKHIPEKFPYENEHQYLEWLKTQAGQLHKDALLNDKIDGQKDFRIKLKENERRIFVIEDVLNDITDGELYIVISQ